MGNAVHTGRRTRSIPYKKDHGIEAAHANSDINVTPLVDVCLVLLIIFMVVTPMIGRGQDVPLPTLVMADEHPEGDQVFVSIDSNYVYVNDWQGINKAEFQKQVEESLKVAMGKAAASGKQDEPVLFLKGDRNMDYERARVVMEWLKEIGQVDIALVVDVASQAANSGV